MAPPLELTQLVDGYQASTARLREVTDQLIEAQWMGLADYRDNSIAEFATNASRTVAGAQRQMASLTDGYLAQFETLATGTSTRPVGIPTAVATGSRGVDPLVVYTRPGVTVWDALSKQVQIDEAIRRGLTRALSIARTDLQLAKTASARRSMSNKRRIVGYSRVLTGAESCALCAVASTQRYHREELLPIHPGCDCDVAPIYGTSDPGQIINEQRLAQTHQAIAETFGASDASARDVVPGGYRNAIVVHEHGEIGPVLGIRGQNFTGPGDL